MNLLDHFIDYAVLGLLMAMSVVALAVAVERRRFYRSVSLSDFVDKRELELALTRKLHIIATIGSNAPYIGLLGTVLGIMLTFHTMGREGFVDTSKIMVGLALALKSTAVGLIVAIPAVTLYNLRVRQAKEMLMKWEIERGRERV